VSNQFSEANDHVGYENYRHVCHKWHYKITKAMVVCLDSKDYVQIRNSLIILIKILPHFPVLAKLSQIIERKIEKVIYFEKSVYRVVLHAGKALSAPVLDAHEILSSPFFWFIMLH
jgi:THO complex subunit 2